MKSRDNLSMRWAISISLLYLFTIFPMGINAGASRRVDDFGLRAVSTPVSFGNPAAPAATFQGVTLEHGLRINHRNGMRIHAHFIVNERVNIHCLLEAHFFDSAGYPIDAAKDATFRTYEGKALVVNEFTPDFQSSEYTDMQLWVPTRSEEHTSELQSQR